MEQPRGFVDMKHPDFVCKLHKSIMGLNKLLELGSTMSPPHYWSLALQPPWWTLLYLSSFMVTLRCFYLPMLMTLWLQELMYLLLLLSLCSCRKNFPIKDLGSLGFFLGIQATRDGDSLHLCQAKYIKDLLYRTPMLGAKPSSSPCPASSKLSKYDGDPLPDLIEYHQVVGALLYCTLTKLEIAFSVN
jgi:hypothetical protein